MSDDEFCGGEFNVEIGSGFDKKREKYKPYIRYIFKDDSLRESFSNMNLCTSPKNGLIYGCYLIYYSIMCIFKNIFLIRKDKEI